MVRRVLLSYLLVVAVTLTLFSFSVQSASADNEPVANSRLSQLMNGYYTAHGNWQSVASTLQEASLLTGQSLTLTDSQGQIIASTEASPNMAGTPVLIQAATNSTVGILYTDNTIATVSNSENGISRWPSFLLTAIIAGLVALGLGWRLTRSLVRPLTELNTAARRLAQGDYSVRLNHPTFSRDELSRLIGNFNRLAENGRKLQQWQMYQLAEVSHDLRTPLTVIRGYLEGLCTNQIADRRSAERAFGAMQLEVDRLLGLVEGLRYSPAGKTRSNRQPVAPYQLASESLSRIALLAQAKGIQLVNRVPLDLKPWKLDRQKLGQALYNLLENASRHTPAGGQIVLEGGQTATELWLQVRDNGEGIAPQHHAHLFERGYQVGPQRGATGLGLAIVKEAVEAHGGSVWVENNREGAGTSFRLNLPID